MLIRTDMMPSGLGYLENDNRAAGGRHFEADTFTCTHCNSVVVLNPARTRPRYKCQGCNHLLCDNCAAARTAGAPCKTMAQQIDEYFTAQARQAVADPQIILP